MRWYGCWLGRWRGRVSLRSGGLPRLLMALVPSTPLHTTGEPGTQPNCGLLPGTCAPTRFTSLRHVRRGGSRTVCPRSAQGRENALRPADGVCCGLACQVRICGGPMPAMASSVITTDFTPFKAGTSYMRSNITSSRIVRSARAPIFITAARRAAALIAESVN